MSKLPRKLTKKCLQKAGRNNRGTITVRARGGGNKKLYRIVDFKRSLFMPISGIVKKIETDPNRTSKIALVCYKKGILSYIISPRNLFPGDRVEAGPTAEIAIGNALPITNVPVGTMVHNVERKPGQGGQLIRSAGTHGKLIKKEKQYSVVRLSSGKLYSVPSQSMATVGIVSNEKGTLSKAGQSR